MCAVFTLAGFVFSLCVASSVAAQSGALTGLGVSFIAKSIIFEVLTKTLDSSVVFEGPLVQVSSTLHVYSMLPQQLHLGRT